MLIRFKKNYNDSISQYYCIVTFITLHQNSARSIIIVVQSCL